MSFYLKLSFQDFLLYYVQESLIYYQAWPIDYVYLEFQWSVCLSYFTINFSKVQKFCSKFLNAHLVNDLINYFRPVEIFVLLCFILIYNLLILFIRFRHYLKFFVVTKYFLWQNYFIKIRLRLLIFTCSYFFLLNLNFSCCFFIYLGIYCFYY